MSEVDVPVLASREEEIFLDEFVRVGFTAQLFQNWALQGANDLTDLLIRAIPLIDETLAFIPYASTRSYFTHTITALGFLQELIRRYDSSLGERKRETVRRKLEDHMRHLTPCQRIRYILISFGMLHYRIFEHSFDTIRVNRSHHQAIRQAANELATVFIKHLAVENEEIPQHLLQSFMWRNDTFLWTVWRGVKVLIRNYEFQDDDGVGISTFNFHTVPVVIFKRGEHQLWAKKIEMKNQASFFGKIQEFDGGQRYLGLKLIRIPYHFEQAVFDGISEEQIHYEFENVTTIVQNRMETGQGDGERNRERRGFLPGGRRRGDDDDDDDDDNNDSHGGGGDVGTSGTFPDQDQDERQRQAAVSYHLVRMDGGTSSITIEDVTTSFRSFTQSVLCEKEVEEWKLGLRKELRNFVENKMLNDKNFKIDSSDWATALSLSAMVFIPLFGSFSLPIILSGWSPTTLSYLLPLVSKALAMLISSIIKEKDKTENGRNESSTPPIQLNPAAVEILNYALEPLHIQLPAGQFASIKENEVSQCLTLCKK